MTLSFIFLLLFSTIRQDEQDFLHACSILSSNQCHSLPWFVLSQTLIYVDAGPLDIISRLRKSKSRGGQTYWLAWLALESIGLFFFLTLKRSLLSSWEHKYAVFGPALFPRNLLLSKPTSKTMRAMLVRLSGTCTVTSCRPLCGIISRFSFEEASIHHSNRLCRLSLRDLESAGHSWCCFLLLCRPLKSCIPQPPLPPSAECCLKCLEISSPSSQKPTGIAIKDDS